VLAVTKLWPKRKQDVLDRCCGVGTKTLQIADAVRDDARILAMDPNERRLETLQRTIDAAGAKNITLANAAMLDEIADAPATFDRILIDAPCSNSGVLMRRPEARYTQGKARNEKLVALQGKLLMECLPRLAPAGRLVYATCSIWPEENERIVGEAMGALGGFRRVEQLTTLPATSSDPTTHHDGGYLCVIERSA
jgi:16S rRNA (cytosine967-C5)-methyltransferase